MPLRYRTRGDLYDGPGLGVVGDGGGGAVGGLVGREGVVLAGGDEGVGEVDGTAGCEEGRLPNAHLEEN